MLRKHRIAGSLQLTLLSLALASLVPLGVAAIESRLAGRRVLNRVMAWHLAKGFALEFSRKEASQGRPLSSRPLAGMQFIKRLLRDRPELESTLAPFRVTVLSGPREARATVGWAEGTFLRKSRESAVRRSP